MSQWQARILVCLVVALMGLGCMSSGGGGDDDVGDSDIDADSDTDTDTGTGTGTDTETGTDTGTGTGTGTGTDTGWSPCDSCDDMALECEWPAWVCDKECFPDSALETCLREGGGCTCYSN